MQLSPASDGKSCKVVSSFKGTVTLTAIVIGTDGSAMAKNSATVTVKYSFLQWIIRIFLLGFIWYK